MAKIVKINDQLEPAAFVIFGGSPSRPCSISRTIAACPLSLQLLQSIASRSVMTHCAAGGTMASINSRGSGKPSPPCGISSRSTVHH
jgi:hypothetical protein